MEQQEIFRVLGMEPTKDERQIRQAYREKLMVTNPEDHPEGFKRLRQAYEAACAYAKTAQEPEQAEDLSPSGQWLARAAALYASLAGRQDVDSWRALFEEDEFVSLEGEEECRKKFFAFLLEHFRYPSSVWKVLDEKLSLQKGQKQLEELLPRDFVIYVQNRCARGEDVDFTCFEGKDDADVDAYLQAVEGAFRAIREEKFDLADQLMGEAERIELYHPIAAIDQIYLYRQRDPSRAAEYGRELLEKYPQNELVLYHVAAVWWEIGEKADAAAVLEKLKAQTDSHYMANRYLSQWYYEQSDYRQAKKCAENVISQGYDADYRRILKQINEKLEEELEERIRREQKPEDILELCWCLLQDEKFYQGYQLALSLRQRIPAEREMEYLGYLAKVCRECALFEDSVQYAHAWRQKLQERLPSLTGEEREKDLDRLRQSYMICISAYHALAYREKEYYSRALEEAEAVADGDEGQIGVLMEKAKIYMEMGEYDQCRELVEILTQEKHIQAAYLILAEACCRQWDAGGVVRTARILIRSFPAYDWAYHQLARVYYELNERERLRELLQEAREKGVKSIYLEAYDYLSSHEVPRDYPFREKLGEFHERYQKPVQDQGDLSHFEEGEREITRLFYLHPGNFCLTIRGYYYLYACQFEKARDDFEKILEAAPADAAAWNGLGCVYQYQGMYEKAMPCFRRAILYMDENPAVNYYDNLADVYNKLGDYRAALAVYEKLEARFGMLSDVGKKIIRCDINLGEKEKALEAIRRYFAKKVLVACSEKFDLYLSLDQWQDAWNTLEEWKRILKKRTTGNVPLNRSWTDYHLNLGWYLLLATKHKSRGLRMLERAARQYDRNAGTTLEGLYAEVILAAFLLGRERTCRKYARLMDAEAKNSRKHPGFSQKSILFSQALCAFFLEGTEAARRLLAKEDGCRTCRTCTCPVCTELLSVRWMLARQEKDKAACEEILKQLQRNAPYHVVTRALVLFGG